MEPGKRQPLRSNSAKKASGIIESRCSYAPILLFDSHGSNCCIDKVRVQPIHRTQRRRNVFSVHSQGIDYRPSVEPRGSGDIEDVSRLDVRPAKMDLLGDDLGNRFDIHIFTLDLSSCGRDLGQWWADNEIYFSDSIERQLEKAGPITLLVGRHNLELEVVQLRIKVGKKLRVLQEMSMSSLWRWPI